MRFPEMSRILVKDFGAEVLVFPAAFNLTTGELHWDILRRSRAVDTQTYFVLCSPARNVDDLETYQAWGSSSVVNPWGKMVADCGFEETLLYCDIEVAEVHKVRGQLPYLTQRRVDMYDLSPLKGSAGEVKPGEEAKDEQKVDD